MTRDELLTALVEAKGPDRTLDFWVWWHCKAIVADPEKRPPADYIASHMHMTPRYTWSVDAALSLVPDEHYVDGVLSSPSYMALYVKYGHNDGIQQGDAQCATPALAICYCVVSHKRAWS